MATIKVPEPEKIKELAESLRYFEIDGKEVRALRYDPQLLGVNREKLKDSSIFVKNIPKDVKIAGFHNAVEDFMKSKKEEAKSE